MSGSGWILIGVFAGTVSLCGAVRGETGAAATSAPELALEYVREAGAERCPDEAALRAQVAERLGGDPFGPTEAGRVRVVLVADGPRTAPLRGRIELSLSGRPAAVRVLASSRADCAELASTLSLALSLAVETLRLARPVAPQGAAAPPGTGVTPPSTPVAATDSSAAPDPLTTTAALPRQGEDGERPVLRRPGNDGPPRTRIRVGVGALAGILTPAPVTAGFSLLAGVQQKWWSMDLVLRGDVPAAAPTAGQGLSSSLVIAQVSTCGRLTVLALCGLLAVGGQVGTFSIAERVIGVAAPYGAAGGRIALEIPWAAPLERLMLQVHGDVLAALHSTTLEADGSVVGRTPPVSGAFGAALIVIVK